MTDFASLTLKVDSTDVAAGVDQLDNLTAAGAKAEKEAGQLATATRGAGAAAADMARQAQASAAGVARLGVSAGQSRQATMILGEQVRQFGTEISLGISPVQAFTQQIGQVTYALQLMGGEGALGGVAAFLGSGWGIAFTTGLAVLAPFVAKLFESSDAADKAKSATYGLTDAINFQKLATRDLIDAINQLEQAQAKQNRTAFESEQLALANAEASLKAAIAKRDEARANIQANEAAALLERGGAGGMAGLGSVSAAVAGSQKALLADINASVGQAQQLIREAKVPIIRREVAAATDAAAAATLKYDKAEADLRKRFEDGSITAAVYQAGLTKITNTLDADKKAAESSTRAHGEHKTALSEADKAYNQAYESSQRYIQSLQDEVDKIGKTPAQIRQMEIERQKEAAATDGQRKAIENLGAAREAEYAAQARQEQLLKSFDATAAMNERIQSLKDEYSLLGLVGPAREKAALALQEESFKAKALKDGVVDVNAAWQEYYEWQTKIIDKGSILEADAEKARILTNELQTLIGQISNLGSVGGAVGGLLGILTGNASAVGGPIGQLLNIGVGTTTKDGKVVAVTIADEIGKIFKPNGEFGKAMQTALEGAGTGLLASQAIFGKQNTLGQLSSGLGGALGEAVGKSLTKGLKGILGDLGGPLGGVIGGLAGGLLGSLFKGTTSGRVTIGSGSNVLGGTSSQLAGQIGQLGTGITDTLAQIANALGGSVGGFGNITIGQRNGAFRVNVGGSGTGALKLSQGAKDFGSDQAAAVAYALQQAIAEGAIKGISQGAQNILKAGKDVQKQLQDALDFEGVFKELDALKNPLQSALDDLDTQFKHLRDVFAEAGASAADYAKLEELLALKRQQILDDQAQRAVSDLSDQNNIEVNLLRLLGRNEDALALARLNELAGIKQSLQPMQEMIYQLQDANDVISKFGPLSTDLKNFKAELLGGLSPTGGFAQAAAKFRSTAASAATGDATALGNLQNTASDFLSAAKDNARSALDYQRAVGEVLASVDKGIFAADSQVEYAQMQIDAIKANATAILDFKAEMATYQQAIKADISELRRLWTRYDGDGLTVKADADTPVYVVTAPGDTVATS